MVPFARLAGVNGMKLTRSAFSLIVKFSDLVGDFLSLVDSVKFFCETQESKSNDINAIREFIKELP
jgi:hypothetical protein